MKPSSARSPYTTAWSRSVQFSILISLPVSLFANSFCPPPFHFQHDSRPSAIPRVFFLYLTSTPVLRFSRPTATWPHLTTCLFNLSTAHCFLSPTQPLYNLSFAIHFLVLKTICFLLSGRRGFSLSLILPNCWCISEVRLFYLNLTFYSSLRTYYLAITAIFSFALFNFISF